MSLVILLIPSGIVLREMYCSDAWQTVFAIDNSIFIWLGFLALAIWQRSTWVIALTGAALVHLALDFPLPRYDGRSDFWPVTWWVFESPVSYWDRHSGAQWFAPTEGVWQSSLLRSCGSERHRGGRFTVDTAAGVRAVDRAPMSVFLHRWL